MNIEDNQQLTKRERRELRRQERRTEELSRSRTRLIKKWSKILSAIFVAVFGIGGLIWFEASRPAVPQTELLSIKQDDWIKGNKEAKVTLVEYLDFECESCGQYYPLVKRLENEFQNEVRFVTRYFPLPGHKNSMPSALAVEAAGRQGKYWEMHDLVFENQRDWGEKSKPEAAIFESYAEQLGLDMNKFKQDIGLKEVKDRIERDKMEGEKLGIQGTPIFFLNGEKIQNPRGYDDFKALLQAELEKTKDN